MLAPKKPAHHMLTATNEKARVHPASPIVIVAVPRRSRCSVTSNQDKWPKPLMQGRLLCNTGACNSFQVVSNSFTTRVPLRIGGCRIGRISEERIMTMYQPGPSTELQRAVASAIHEHWLLFLIEGIVL